MFGGRHAWFKCFCKWGWQDSKDVLSCSVKLQKQNLKTEHLGKCLLGCGDPVYQHWQTLKRVEMDPDPCFLCSKMGWVWPCNTDVAFKGMQVVIFSYNLYEGWASEYLSVMFYNLHWLCISFWMCDVYNKEYCDSMEMSLTTDAWKKISATNLTHTTFQNVSWTYLQRRFWRWPELCGPCLQILTLTGWNKSYTGSSFYSQTHYPFYGDISLSLRLSKAWKGIWCSEAQRGCGISECRALRGHSGFEVL